jgi:hypothetical protein
MKKIILFLFLLSSKLTFGQIFNGGFEIWDTTYTACYDSDLISLFAVPDPSGGVINRWPAYYSPFTTCGTARTTDSYSGNYALLLYNWYHYDYGQITYLDSISSRPHYLQGYFKYITGGATRLSQGTAIITLTRFNGTSNDTIASGTYQFDSTVTYTPFQINLNYTSALNPDSIYIYIKSGNDNCGSGSPMICNLLYLDDITLSNSPLGIEGENVSNNDITVYPNPFSSVTTLQTETFLKDATLSVYNSSGQTVKQINNISGQTITLHRDNLSGGLYFIQLKQSNKIIKVEKIIITD